MDFQDWECTCRTLRMEPEMGSSGDSPERHLPEEPQEPKKTTIGLAESIYCADSTTAGYVRHEHKRPRSRICTAATSDIYQRTPSTDNGTCVEMSSWIALEHRRSTFERLKSRARMLSAFSRQTATLIPHSIEGRPSSISPHVTQSPPFIGPDLKLSVPLLLTESQIEGKSRDERAGWGSRPTSVHFPPTAALIDLKQGDPKGNRNENPGGNGQKFSYKASLTWLLSLKERWQSIAAAEEAERNNATPAYSDNFDLNRQFQVESIKLARIAQRRGEMGYIGGLKNEDLSRARMSYSQSPNQGSQLTTMASQPQANPYWRSLPPLQRVPPKLDWRSHSLTFGPANPMRTSNKGVNSRQRLKRLAVIVFIAVLAVLLTVAWLSVSNKAGVRSEQPLLCRTDDCREYAMHLDFRRNHTVDPCQDFNVHVCSSWQPPKGYIPAATAMISEVAIGWVHSLPRFLEEAVKTSKVARKAKAMHKACLTQRTADPSDIEYFRAFLTKLNMSWPEHAPKGSSALGVLIDLALNWRDTFWLALRVDTGTQKQNRKRLLITPGNQDALAFFARNHFQVRNQDTYNEYWMVHFKSLYGNITPPVSTKSIHESGLIQDAVLTSLLDAVGRKPKMPLLIPLSRIGNYTGRLTSSHWLDELNARVGVGSPFSGEDEAFVEDRFLLEAIGALFKMYDDQTLLSQISWEFVQTHIAVVDKEPLKVTIWGKTYAAPYVPLYCAMFVENMYRPLLAFLYSATSVTSIDYVLVNAGLKNLVRKAIDKVNSSWLSSGSKATALQKYETMNVSLWPPLYSQRDLERFYQCFPKDGKSFAHMWIEGCECMRQLAHSSLLEGMSGMHNIISSRSALYDYLTNTVGMTVTALAPPVYYTHGTRAMFYGGIGFIFASEMMKALDLTGAYILANGSVPNKRWLTAADWDELQRKRRCLEAGDEDYFSRVSALEVTYSAFVEKDGLNYSRHQISKELTEAQVFFLTLCRSMCHVEVLPFPIVSDTDCNRMLKYSPHFAEAFQCAPGSPMNPEKKCGFFD